MALAIAALTACCAQGESSPSTLGVSDTIDGMVASIVDGDTIEVATSDGRLTVRLVGINAPDEGECYRERAREHLVDTLQGSDVTVDVIGTDQFGRTLANVYVRPTGRHLNLEMVSGGLAIATTPEDHDLGGEALLDAEEDAFAAERGLWASDACGASARSPIVAIDSGSSTVDPPGDDRPEEETVVLVGGDQEADLSGWALRDESSRHRYRFPEGSLLRPGSSIVVTSGDPGWVPPGETVWNNGGDMALLLDPAGNVAARWRY